MADRLHEMSARQLLEAYRARDLSPVDVTAAILDRIDRYNPTLNCFCFVDHEGALEQAREAEARWLRKQPRGLLDGVPVSIKDLILTRGMPTLKGSRTVARDQAWDVDAPAVARLREHGAIIVGKTTTPEFGWKGATDSPLTGITRNPWNLGKTPGGSSGGAAAALAAGMGPLAIGSDGAGSIRLPASFCGVYGIKASFGVVPAHPPQPHPLRTLSHVGPMARCVEDATLTLAVLSGPDDRDWLALRDGPRDYRKVLEDGVEGMRIAYSPDLGFAKVDAEVAAITDAAVTVFEDLGANIEQRDPGFDDPMDVWMTHFRAAGPLVLGTLRDEQIDLMEPELRRRWAPDTAPSLTEYFAAAEAREALGQAMARFHRDFDLLLTPVSPVPPFDIGRLGPDHLGPDPYSSWLRFTPFCNLTHQPAASVPCGFTSDGLPVGLHIVGPMLRDDLVLRASRAFEQAKSIEERHPELGA